MQDILAEIGRIRGIGGALLFNADGLLMDSMLRSDVDEQSLAAAAGTLIAEAARACEQLGLGRQQSFSAASEKGGVFACAAGPAMLLVLVDPQANLALLRLEVKPFAERIAQRLAL